MILEFVVPIRATNKSEAVNDESRAVYHDINDQDGDITQRASSATQICERLVSRGIDDEKTWHFVFLFAILSQSQFPSYMLKTHSEYRVQNGSFLLDSVDREISSTDLLSDTASFAFLHVRLPNLCSQISDLPSLWEEESPHLI
jgi:hypothetical protein